MKRIQQTYILIGGFEISQPSQWKGKTIVLARGNRYGEDHVKTLKTFPPGTPYKTVVEAAEEFGRELGFRIGRKFNRAEWNGEILAAGPYVPTPGS